MENRTFEATYPAYSFAPLVTLAMALAEILAAKHRQNTPAHSTAAVTSIG